MYFDNFLVFISRQKNLFFQIKAESEDEDSDTLSVSLNVDFDKLDRSKSKTKEYVFVTEDGKTAERFEDFGNNDDFCWKEISMENKKKNSFTEASITPSKIQVQNEYTKPKMSYAQLIAEALLTGRERMLTLNEIYIAINKKHPYYSLDASTGRNWQNAIRSVCSSHVHYFALIQFVLLCNTVFGFNPNSSNYHSTLLLIHI